MNKKTTIIVVIIVIVVLIGLAFFMFGGHGSAPQTQPSQAGGNTQPPAAPAAPTASPAATGLYTSPDDGFAVNFSGTTPQVTKSTFNSPTAGPIPLTKYIVQTGTGLSTQYYVIYVYHYPQTYQFPTGYLTGAMNLFAAAVSAKYPGAKLTSQEQTQLLGAPAVAGTITVQISGQSFDNYLVITTKNQNTYGIGTYGLSQSDYNAFVNSFTFTQ